MNPIILLDTETSSTDPTTGALLEVAIALWSVEHGRLIRARSWLVEAAANEAEEINGIPVSLLSFGEPGGDVLRTVHNIAVKSGVSCIVAHHAEFDRQWVGPALQNVAPWVCSMDDIEWPRKTGRSLTAVALGHGVGVVDAHRALPDVLTMSRLFDRVAETHSVAEMLTRAMRPKKLVAALLPFDRKDEAKKVGFQWHPEVKQWRKRVFVDDLPKLGFDVREVA